MDTINVVEQARESIGGHLTKFAEGLKAGTPGCQTELMQAALYLIIMAEKTGYSFEDMCADITPIMELVRKQS